VLSGITRTYRIAFDPTSAFNLQVFRSLELRGRDGAQKDASAAAPAPRGKRDDEQAEHAHQ
jgi:hypothetical protein